MPAMPKKWTDPKVVPAQKVAEKDLADLEAIVKPGKDAAALKAVHDAKQKLGNWIAFVQANKTAERDKIAPTVITLYNTAWAAVDKAPKPSGKYSIAVTAQSSPKFLHNAQAANTMPVWDYQYWDDGLPDFKKSFQISMEKMDTKLKGDENKQAKWMSDAAIAVVKGFTKASDVKIVKS